LIFSSPTAAIADSNLEPSAAGSGVAIGLGFDLGFDAIAPLRFCTGVGGTFAERGFFGG
jgi:hypothetical protein